MIANATGCSSIYSASVPSTPYTKNEKGQGPVFNNSLFEDFCEFGLGMALGNKKMKERVAKLLQEMIDGNASDEYKALAKEWIENKDDAEKTKEIAPKLRKCIAESAAAGCPVCKELQTLDPPQVHRRERCRWLPSLQGAPDTGSLPREAFTVDHRW